MWVIYGLLMTIFGAQQILRYIFFVPTGLLGEMTRETHRQRAGAAGHRHARVGLHVERGAGLAQR